ncbi:MAG TPA: histidine kinase [Candidatus Anaerotruncus excrementipullorum]|uniref:Histidine kinase n=1 Tax=Candidatus Anaerotruncus excrementipullorum TaxID=2838465 RepID=A0A9D1WS16_9FIRM|nr:histidine kinase [Candidatus Anaerotruncus excrementipullorum]
MVVLLAALGGFNLLLPRASWYLSYGWRYKNAEPSDLVLAINRIGGGAILAVALLLLLL